MLLAGSFGLGQGAQPRPLAAAATAGGLVSSVLVEPSDGVSPRSPAGAPSFKNLPSFQNPSKLLSNRCTLHPHLPLTLLCRCTAAVTQNTIAWGITLQPCVAVGSQSPEDGMGMLPHQVAVRNTKQSENTLTQDVLLMCSCNLRAKSRTLNRPRVSMSRRRIFSQDFDIS